MLLVPLFDGGEPLRIRSLWVIVLGSSQEFQEFLEPLMDLTSGSSLLLMMNRATTSESAIYHSIVLQLQRVCDADMIYTNVWSGLSGSCDGARTFRNSPLHATAEAKTQLTFHRKSFLMADSAYGMPCSVAKTLKNVYNLNPAERRYDIHVAHVRCVMEQSYALLKGRWHRLKMWHWNVHLMAGFTIACNILHNSCIWEEEECQD